MSNATRILQKIESGDPSAAEELLPLVYNELRKLAAAKLAQEKPGQILQATALVHEAYMRLVDSEKTLRWDSRGHFFAAAAVAIRHILVEEARRTNRIKRGGERQRISMDGLALPSDISCDQLLELDEAISRLELDDPVKAKVVQLRFFAGMNHEEVAQSLGIAAITARRHWRYARAWLRREMGDSPDNEDATS